MIVYNQSPPMFEFHGRHMMASIYETNVHDAIFISFTISGCLQQAGANIVGYTEHNFDNGAITFCYLLSESHCTVHTYPEHNCMWLDVFTCGTTFDMSLFEKLLLESFHIGHMDVKMIERQ